MVEEANLEFRLRKFEETRSYYLDQMKHNDLMSGKYKKRCKYLNFVENLLILPSTITDYVSISKFTSLVGVPVSITSSEIGIKICGITAGIEKYKSITRKKNKKHNKCQKK